MNTYECKTVCRVNMIDEKGHYKESGSVPAGTRASYVASFRIGMVTLRLQNGRLIEVNPKSFEDKWRCVS